ncbi:MAG: efflux RND transporter periplasmic adaptor subunit [Rickettsiaceae bacterium]|nr:efflux RND transporter periplasmic adaptor subunit [Rickettsiaceae bacterium]
MKTIYLPFILLLLVSCDKKDPLLHGYVEADYQYVSPTSSGVLQEVYVKRGQSINKGGKLFALDDIELKIAVETAESKIVQAEAILEESTKDYSRIQKLAKTSNASQATLDQKESEYAKNKAALKIEKQNLLVAKKKLSDSVLNATMDAYIEDILFSPGEFVQAGQVVATLLSADDIKIRFFVPQAELPKIIEGQSVSILCDGCREPIAAKITYIAKQAEYTPPVIYSSEAREKMVFMVEAKPNSLTRNLHPGLPVDVKIHSSAHE